MKTFVKVKAESFSQFAIGAAVALCFDMIAAEN
jgi:hypothetical protein